MERHLTVAATALALVLAAPLWTSAHAQDAEDNAASATEGTTDSGDTGEEQTTAAVEAFEPVEEADIVPLAEWDNDALYADGWSAEEFIDDAAVISGATGEEIGDVENLLIGPDGQILSVIAEVGGFWDIGDTHVSVPWDEVEVAADHESITVPLTQDNVEDYSLYGEYGYEDFIVKPETDQAQVVDDDLLTGARVWKASELIDDYALLEGGVAYGYVDDLIFNGTGDLQAMIVEPDIAYGAYGPYAYPWYGYPYYRPGLGYYELPYADDEIAELEPFDYGLLDNGEVAED